VDGGFDSVHTFFHHILRYTGSCLVLVHIGMHYVDTLMIFWTLICTEYCRVGVLR
jgi:hypothetical protein